MHKFVPSACLPVEEVIPCWASTAGGGRVSADIAALS